MMILHFLPKLVLALVVLIMSASIAFAAMTVDTAKQQGLVGEQPDGMLGIVSEGSPDVQSLVDTTNAERLAKYQSIASKNGTDIEQVKALAGRKLIENTPSGEYVLNAQGIWQKK